MTYTLLYEDDEIFVLNKAAGVLVHKSKATSVREPTLVDILEADWGRRFHPVHRLDRATSGVLLFAKDPQSAAKYGKLFEERLLEKKYHAVVRGFAEDQTVDYPLRHLERSDLIQDAQTQVRQLKRIVLPFPNGQYSESRYSLLELKPQSGRRHQLRRHMKHLHHPIIGDTVYGHGLHNRIFREKFDCHRLLLHHAQLKIEHSSLGKWLDIRAPYDSAMQRIVDLFSH